MHRSFRAISLSHKNAPLEIREQTSLDMLGAKHLMEQMRNYSDVSEALVLSTCNRTEIYYASDKNQFDLILKLVGVVKGIGDLDVIRKYFRDLSDHDDAVRHLYDVALGLEAQVVGDLQIINQVKQAYQWSADEDMAGPFIHRLLHSIFYANKRVVQETAFRDGAASVSYALVESVQLSTAATSKPKVLVIGLGDIGEDVVRNLERIKDKEVWISNRSMDKAKELASTYDCQTISFDELKNTVARMDVIISAVDMSSVLIKKSWFASQNLHSHKYLFDLSVPRSIDPDIESINGLLLYNIDNIEAHATAVLDKRLAAISDVQLIINESIADFSDWTQEMEVSPAINKLKNALEDIRQAEIDRYVKKLSDDETALVDKVTRSMMQKIIRLPILQLKAACKRGEAESLVEVLNDLFNLEQASEKQNK